MAILQELRWIQPRWNQRKYELKEGDRTIARLEHRGKWKPSVHIILDDQELVIQRRGAFRVQTLVMSGDIEIARFSGVGKDRNTITFRTGRTFRWSRQGFWSTTYSFTAPDNEVLMTFRSSRGFLRSESIVQVTPGSSKYPEARVLMAFGWYLILAAQAAATTAAAAG